MDEMSFRGIGMTSQRTRERLVARLRDEGIRDQRVLEVIRRTPRHLFVDEALASRAYDDTALPIGFGQTISQPFVVARMTELLLEDGVPQRVLEIGTGSGYQAAVLAQLVPSLHTIERIKALADRARRHFRTLKLHNVRVRYGDGNEGWPQNAPYDAVLLTAAPSRIPQPLLDQVVIGGRLIAPVGGAEGQELHVYQRTEAGIVQRVVSQVSFVPMLGGTL